MTEIEHKVSIPTLRQQAKTCAAQGNYHLATSLKEAADELSLLRNETIRLKSTIREIRSIANLSILHQV